MPAKGEETNVSINGDTTYSWYHFIILDRRRTYKSISRLISIDHENLRYVEDEELTQFQVNEIKRNIQKSFYFGMIEFSRMNALDWIGLQL